MPTYRSEAHLGYITRNESNATASSAAKLNGYVLRTRNPQRTDGTLPVHRFFVLARRDLIAFDFVSCPVAIPRIDHEWKIVPRKGFPQKTNVLGDGCRETKYSGSD